MSTRDRARYSARDRVRGMQNNEIGSRSADASVPGANRGQGYQSAQ
jgi:hypothetical protein